MLATPPALAARNDDPKPAQPMQGVPAPASSPAKMQNAGTASNTSAAAQTTMPANQGSATPRTISAEITFVQITDAHLFDGGKNRQTDAQAAAEQNDTWDAFRWAIRQTNALIDGGAKIDFVVFTGDMGLDFVRSDRNEKLCKPYNKDKDDFLNKDATHGMKFYSPKEAAEAVADQFRLLKVKTIYILPGNNDLANEAVCDMGRYTKFVKETALAMPSGGPILVDLASTIAIEGPFRLLGLNSASFKKRENYNLDCPLPLAATATPAPTSTPAICNETPDCSKNPGQAMCPNYKDCKSNPALSGCFESELTRIGKIVGVGDDLYSTLIFTHIPDVMDPFNVRNFPDKCYPTDRFDDKKTTSCGSWNWESSPQSYQQWESTISNSKVAAVFAGHLHDGTRSNYATTADNTLLYNGIDVAKKTWIAPPLALKYQDKQLEDSWARGLLLVRVQKNRIGPAVSVIPFWYQREKCNCNEILKIVLRILGAAVVIGLLVWAFSGEHRKTTMQLLRTVLSSPPVLTLISATIVGVAAWQILGFITEELNVPHYFYLVIIFGAIGGITGSLLSNRKFVWSTISPATADEPAGINLGVVKDIVVGMAGSAAVGFIFDNGFNISDAESKEKILLISISLIAGIVGKPILQLAGETFLNKARGGHNNSQSNGPSGSSGSPLPPTSPNPPAPTNPQIPVATSIPHNPAQQPEVASPPDVGTNQGGPGNTKTT